MIDTLAVIDDLLPQDYWEYLRHLARAAFADGATEAEPPASVSLAETISNALRVRTMIEHEQRFRFPQVASPDVHRDIHNAAWASVLFLDSYPPGFGGMAFWYHAWLQASRMVPGADQAVTDLVHRDRDDETKWQLESVVGAKANRLVIYPTSAFHSISSGLLVHESYFDIQL